MPSKSTFTHNDLRSMESRYNKGESLANLAEDFVCSVSTVTRALRDRGVKIRPRGRPSKAA